MALNLDDSSAGCVCHVIRLRVANVIQSTLKEKVMRIINSIIQSINQSIINQSINVTYLFTKHCKITLNVQLCQVHEQDERL